MCKQTRSQRQSLRPTSIPSDSGLKEDIKLLTKEVCFLCTQKGALKGKRLSSTIVDSRSNYKSIVPIADNIALLSRDKLNWLQNNSDKWSRYYWMYSRNNLNIMTSSEDWVGILSLFRGLLGFGVAFHLKKRVEATHYCKWSFFACILNEH